MIGSSTLSFVFNFYFLFTPKGVRLFVTCVTHLMVGLKRGMRKTIFTAASQLEMIDGLMVFK